MMNTLKASVALCLVLVASTALASTNMPVHISLKADSVPVVGNEGAVTATVTVDYDLPNVTVEIMLPTEGKVVGSSQLVAPRASKGTPVEFRAKMTFSTPGIKMVRATVKSAERPGVVWSDAAYVLLDVGSTASSTVTDSGKFISVPKLKSKGSGKSIGRPRPKSVEQKPRPSVMMAADTAPSTQQEVTSNQLLPGQIEITGNWTLVDRTGQTVGLKYALVELRDGGTFERLLATARTDLNGNYTFPPVDNPGTLGAFVRCYTQSQATGNAAGVRYSALTDWYSTETDWMLFEDGTHSMGSWSVDDSVLNYQAWWILDDMTKAYDMMPDPVGGHTLNWSLTSSGGAYYHPGGDIYVDGPDCETPDVPLHEMGHSVQYNIYGDYLPNVGGSHSLFSHSSVALAWIEGWATTWMFWVTNDPYYDPPGDGCVDLENRTWGDGGDEGSDVEARVAGALWDIFDTNNEGYDKCSRDWLDMWEIVYHHNNDTFWQFWNDWKEHYDTHGPIACIYQNTIDWNTTPTFAGLPDVTIAEDEFRANVIDLDDYASDPESQDYQLAFNIVSVSDANLQIGINANHEVQVQGMPNWSGSSIVQISCNDGIISVHDSFTVNVTPANDPPVIQNLPDQSVNEDGSLIHAINLNLFTTDPETLPPSLTYTITGNTNPSCGVSLVSSYYVNITPVANWSGTSDVKIRATDPQGLWSEDTFRVTVNAVNDPPIITGLPDRTLNEDTSLNNTIDLWAYTTDVEVPASALTYTIQSSEMPVGAVTIDSNRYIDITPPTNLFGQFYVTIRAWDFEGGYGDDTFKVTINSVPDPPVLKYIPDELIETSAFPTTRWVDLWKSASDPDGPDSELTFTVTSNTDTHIVASIDSARSLKLIAPARWSGNSIVTVRATDPTGRWDEDTLSVIVGRNCETCSEAFGLADGAWVFFDRNTVTVSHLSAFYMEDDTRVSGIRVNSTLNPDEGRYVTVAGQMATYEGERAVDCTSYTLGGVDPTPPQPLGMTNGAMGGKHLSVNTPAVPAGRLNGLYNVGLLVKTTGKVVSRTSNSFWIDDGSGVPYSFSTKGLYVDCQPIAMYAPPLGSRVAVTGASGAGLVGGNTVNTLRLRNSVDVKGMGGKVAFVYSTAASTAAVYAAVLGGQGWSTTTLPLSGIASADLSAYDIIILGADTGNWSDSAKVNNIVNSDKSVIAMGDGGARFLDRVPDLYIGWGNSGVFMLKQGYVDNQGNVLYWFDNPITVPTDKILDTMVTTATTTCLYNPPAGVYGLLRHPTDSAYWAVAQQGRFMQWGYDTLPSNLNPVAKDLLVNCLYYMINRH